VRDDAAGVDPEPGVQELLIGREPAAGVGA